MVGTVKPHHRFMRSCQLILIDTLEEAIERVGQEIEQRLDPPSDPDVESETRAEPPLSADQVSDAEGSCEDHKPTLPLSGKEAVVLLDSIPGINQRAAEGILAEIGLDMSRFPTPAHLSSWAGMCPGNHESAGKRLSGRTRKGSPWLRQLLVEAAHAAAHTKGTYLAALYHRIKARQGAKKAMIAVGHKLLVICYHVLDRRRAYQELGENYFDERQRQAVEKRLVQRLEKLGYEVSLQPATQVA